MQDNHILIRVQCHGGINTNEINLFQVWQKKCIKDSGLSQVL